MDIKKIMEKMDYGTAPEAVDEAQNWLLGHKNRFGHFIDGAFTEPEACFTTYNPADRSVLAEISQASESSLDKAVASAQSAFQSWSQEAPHKRAKSLYALARLLQKHSRLFATLETLDNGKPIRESRDIDIPLAQRHFYYHAGMAQLMPIEMPERMPLGICGQIIPWNFPLLMLAWKVAPALAMGNTVVLKPAEYTSLTALLFGEICNEAGLPKGVVNIVTGDGAVGERIVTHQGIQKIAFTGSTEVGRKIRQATAGSGKSLTLELGGKSPFIVFDDADLDSAVEGLVDSIWFNQGQVCCAGSRLLVQEGIAEKLIHKIKTRMGTLRIGSPLDKSIDIGAIIDPIQHKRISDMVNSADAGDVFQAQCETKEEGCFYPPTLITGLSPADPLMQEEIFGPVLTTTTFRTPKEAIALANNTTYGLAASIWSENINLCLGIAPKIQAGVIWINGANMFDANAGFGGMKESGFGREGGKEGLLAYTKPKRSRELIGNIKPFEGSIAASENIDRTAKLYIGGKQSRPDSGYSHPVFDADGKFIAHVPKANRKDIRNAVEAANAAASWSATTGHQRAQILYYMGENLSARAAEFAVLLDRFTGKSDGELEVEQSIERLFAFAAYADKFSGELRDVPIRGMALKTHEPCGIIGAICPQKSPLLGLITVLAAGLSMGNRMILVASEISPLVATELYQILDTSDVPKGSVSILTGSHQDLAAPLAAHMDIAALWSFSSTEVSKIVETHSALNLKRTWVNHGYETDWEALDYSEFLTESIEPKTIWIPFGEG